MSQRLKSETVSFWEVLNPPIYLVSLLPGLVVIQWNHHPPGAPFWIGILAVICLQHGINVMNDWVDGRRGADGEKRESWLKYHRRESLAWAHGNVFLGIGLTIGVSALWSSGNLNTFLFLGPLALLGIAYNMGDLPISYGRMGEWVTALCYGPGVFIGYWILCGDNLQPIRLVLGSTGCGSIAVSCLLSHQPKQILTDAAVGKNSFAVRNGASAAVIWSRITLNLFYLCLLLGTYGGRPLIPFGLLLGGLSLLSLRISVNPKNQLLMGLAGAVIGLLC